MRTRVIQGALIFVVGVVFGAATIASAQAQRASAVAGQDQRYTMSTDTAGNIISSTKAEPMTLSNEALGLRVQGRHHGRVVGTLVAKINGEWVEVQFAPQDSLATR